MSTPPRPAREIAIAARRIAVNDPANYDNTATPATPQHRGHAPASRAARAAVAATATATVAVLSLTRPWLAAGLALLMLSAAIRLTWQRWHQHGH